MVNTQPSNKGSINVRVFAHSNLTAKPGLEPDLPQHEPNKSHSEPETSTNRKKPSGPIPSIMLTCCYPNPKPTKPSSAKMFAQSLFFLTKKVRHGTKTTCHKPQTKYLTTPFSIKSAILLLQQGRTK